MSNMWGCFWRATATRINLFNDVAELRVVDRCCVCNKTNNCVCIILTTQEEEEEEEQTIKLATSSRGNEVLATSFS